MRLLSNMIQLVSSHSVRMLVFVLIVAGMAGVFDAAQAVSQQQGGDAAPPSGDQNAGDDAKKEKDKNKDETPPPAEPEEPKGPMYEQEPYDIVTLDEKHESEVFKVKPIVFTGKDTRYQHGDHRLTDKLVVELVADSTKYEILWRHIDKIDLFEERVLREAEAVVAQSRIDRRKRENGKLDEAYKYYDFLLREYPELPALPKSLQFYRFRNAQALLQQERFPEAMAILEDVYTASPDNATVAATLSNAIDALLRVYVGRKDFFHARKLLLRLDGAYDGERVAAIGTWRGRFAQKAGQLRDAARQKLDAGELREARQLSREMLTFWPTVEQGEKLIADIDKAYPLVVVGVFDPALDRNVASLHNWGARRAGRITGRTLMQYMGKGPAGGHYECALGTVEVGETREQVTLNLNAQSLNEDLTAFDISNRLLDMANRESPVYVPAWAALMEGVEVSLKSDQNYAVEIAFRRPFVLPEALLQFPLEVPGSSARDGADSQTGNGLYYVVSREGQDILYGINSKVQEVGTRRAVEIVERYFSDPEVAITALERGEIDMLDRLAPSDVGRFRDSKSMIVQRYALPTVHVLTPSRMNKFMEKTGFRRGLAYSINRDLILERGILRAQELPGCRPVSGPFVAGIERDDASGYAYDKTVQDFNYDPVLGKILLELTLQEVIVTAEKNKEKAPTEIPPIVIGHPAREGPRTACALIREQLKALGLTVKLKEFPPGVTTDPKKQCDLVYTELFVWEPIVDSRRLLGDNGLAPAHNYYVNLALQQLDGAKTWKEARQRLNELHHYVHNEAVVIPLWQLTEHVVHHRRIRGIGKNPAFLYQDILQWRVVPDLEGGE